MAKDEAPDVPRRVPKFTAGRDVKVSTPHPGRRLEKLLREYRISRKQLQSHLQVYPMRIDRVVRGESPVSFDLAKMLAQAFSTTEESWVYEQALYDYSRWKQKVLQPDVAPIPRPVSLGNPVAMDRCICGHWGWKHIEYPDGGCIEPREDGTPCTCPMYFRLGGYLAAAKALRGLDQEQLNRLKEAEREVDACDSPSEDPEQGGV